MTWSVRARLTAWYLAVVVVVLVSGALAAGTAQRQDSLEKLDADLDRTMATLLGVLRTEFGEGLDLPTAASEASAEVVAPGRALGVASPGGRWLALWGLHFDGVPPPAGSSVDTLRTPSGRWRVRREVRHDGPGPHTAVVMAPMGEVEAQQRATTRALALGALLSLVVAGVGGWVIGRQALTPLTTMASQAREVDANHPRARLTVPPVDDEVSQVGAAFNGVLDRLADALDHQRQFMADASHELRTPVSVVRTTAQVTLQRSDRTADEYREAITIVGEQAGRLSRIVDDMFLLSRAEAQGVPLRSELVYLDEIVAETARALRVMADQRGVTIVARGVRDGGVNGDDALLRRLVGNLLDNAIRHAAAGGAVHTEVASAGTWIVLRVINDGPGIPAADRDRIFERFVRLGPSDGSGLGLPIARWVAQAHGGSLELETSEPGRTVFIVTLPASSDAAHTG